MALNVSQEVQLSILVKSLDSRVRLKGIPFLSPLFVK